jgi:glycosyltransferase involved in cell wall biosynthesis
MSERIGGAGAPKLISVVTPCFNEEENIRAVYERVKAVFGALPQYRYEHLFIDNASQDATVAILRDVAAADKNVKVIVNTRNFGPYRSPTYGTFQAHGDAIIPIAGDLQDPPELIPAFLAKWEEGFKVVAAIKASSKESFLMKALRQGYYHFVAYLSEDAELIRNFSGFGLFDKEVIRLIESANDHYPYIRGLISDMGFPVARVNYVRPERKRGFSKNNLYDLYSQAMNGITHHSKMPLRLATFVGFFLAAVSIAIGFGYGLYKLVFWQSFSLGIAPIVIGIFFFSGVQLIFLGVIGEYLGAIYGRLFQRWMVIERERINFDDGQNRPAGEPDRIDDRGDTR